MVENSLCHFLIAAGKTEFIDEMMHACARHGEKVIDKNYMNAVFSHALIKVGFCNK